MSTIDHDAIARATAKLDRVWQWYREHGRKRAVLHLCGDAGKIAATSGHPLQWWSDQQIDAWGDSELWGAFHRGFVGASMERSGS